MQKNSGGKRQAYYQPHVSTGKRQVGRLMVLGGCTQRSETSRDSTGHQAVCAPIQNQEPIRPAVPMQVIGLFFFHCYFSLPPYRLPKCDVTHSPPRGQRFLSGAGDPALSSYYTGPDGPGPDNSQGGM